MTFIASDLIVNCTKEIHINIPCWNTTLKRLKTTKMDRHLMNEKKYQMQYFILF